jgi:hypothetical protein
LTADNSVFQDSNANDMRVTQDLTSFGEIIAHAHSVDENKCRMQVNIDSVCNRIICCQIFYDLLLKSAFERMFSAMQLILVKIK